MFLFVLAGSALAKEKVLAWDDGKQVSRRSSSGTGHVVEFTAPKGKWWVTAVRVFGARYGGGYDPGATMFTVAVGKESFEAKYELFAPGKFDWVDIPLATPVEVKKTFPVCVAFSPTRTKGVFVGIAKPAKESHSFFGLPGGPPKPAGADIEWMIRAVITDKKPKAAKKKPAPDHRKLYEKDFAFLEKTVKQNFPAFEKKGVDWKKACREWRPKFHAAKDDKEHILNVHRLLATLGDAHTGVTASKAGEHVPSFDGLYGAGMWIAVEGETLVLRALMPKHHLAYKLPHGSELIEIDGRPATKVHQEVRTKLRTWHGWSSTHFLDARLSFQFFPFGEKTKMRAKFRTPEGKVRAVNLPRWGPGGRGLSRQKVTTPNPIAFDGLATTHWIDEETTYFRILGSMNEKTRIQVFDKITYWPRKGMILDGRGMGGGGDSAAWTMAGLFFQTMPSHGHTRIRALGKHTGPVVMLIDERMISSAETFTWAMTETNRVVTVGRPTGGATIIPRSFDAPSGLFSFRLGCTDRKTPGKGVQPEGIGTAPDIYVPYTAKTLADGRDPTFETARVVLARLLAGDSREKAIAAGKRSLE